jgi:hypothetical protein
MVVRIMLKSKSAPDSVIDSFISAGNTNLRGRLSTVDLLIKVASFVKKQIIFTFSKIADVNWFVLGGQPY